MITPIAPKPPIRKPPASPTLRPNRCEVTPIIKAARAEPKVKRAVGIT